MNYYEQPEHMSEDEIRSALDAVEGQAVAYAEYIQPVYALLKWEWGCRDIDAHIPTVQEITDLVRYIVNAFRGHLKDEWFMDNHVPYVGTGGLWLALERRVLSFGFKDTIEVYGQGSNNFRRLEKTT